jgi:uncharacterized membrane protein
MMPPTGQTASQSEKGVRVSPGSKHSIQDHISDPSLRGAIRRGLVADYLVVSRPRPAVSSKGVTIMARITRDIFIKAPVDQVFAYHSNPANQIEYWPSMIEIKDVEHFPGGGMKYRWTYKMAGIRLEGLTETMEFDKNERIVTKSRGGIESTFTYEYKPEGEGTRVSVDVDYKVPVPVVGKVAEAFVLKFNEREVETILANLKDRLEAWSV